MIIKTYIWTYICAEIPNLCSETSYISAISRYISKTGFYFCLPEAVLYSVGRKDMSKLTSKMESTHKIGLENRRINYLRPLVRQTRGSPVIFAFFKNMPGWFPVGYWFSACTGSFHGGFDPACSSWHLSTMLSCTTYHTEVIRSF